MIKYFKKSIPSLVLISGLMLTSCTLEPVKVKPQDRAEITKDTLNTLHVAKDSQKLKIDLRQAIALALENNLEYRLKKVQAALSYKQYDLAKTDLYPNIDLRLDYNHRNRDYIKTLGNVTGGDATAQSLIPHTIKTGSVTFNWDILDFGLSYVRAQQASDRYLLAQEQRKQMASSIINDVIKNYTLAYYGQEIRSKIKDLEASVDDSLKISDQVVAAGVGEMQQHLALKKTIMEEYRQTKENITFFNQSYEKLLSLINYHPTGKADDFSVTLVEPDYYVLKLPALDSSLLQLDTVALFYRPEISGSIYKVRETEKQKIAVTLEKLPSLGFRLGYNYESDKFLKFQNWWSDNLNLAWNLLHMATIPAARDTAETQLEAEKLTQLASSAVILGEIRVLLYNYKMKKYDFMLAEKQSSFATDIYNNTLNLSSTGLGDENSLIRDKLVAMNSELAKLRAFVDARNLLEDVITALGLYHQAGEFVNKSYVDTAIINKWLNNFNAKDLDQIINSEYKNVEKLYNLSETSKVHDSKNECTAKNQQSNKDCIAKKYVDPNDKLAMLKIDLPKIAQDYWDVGQKIQIAIKDMGKVETIDGNLVEATA